MTTINTTDGKCTPNDLGFTLIHEHLTFGFAGCELDNASFDRKKELRRAIDNLKELKDLGVNSFVDPCPMDTGRDPVFAAEVADKTGMRIIVATGLHTDVIGMPPYFHGVSVDDIAELYVRELADGIGTTGVRAGIIKTATGGIPGVTKTSERISDNEEKCLRAAAKAHKATGAPILCHNDETSPLGRETLDIFADEGVDFNRVLISHACGVGDMRYYFEILERGAWLAFDRFGVETIASDKMRLASLFGLIAVGHDRIMLSSDYVNCWVGRVTGGLDLIKACPNWSQSHVMKNILPRLREGGVADQAIQTMMVDNPRSYFGGIGATN